MTKIRVEFEVPENCKDCMMFDNYIIYDLYTDSFKRCDECKQAEVEND
jgi:hypothetical protein